MNANCWPCLSTPNILCLYRKKERHRLKLTKLNLHWRNWRKPKLKRWALKYWNVTIRAIKSVFVILNNKVLIKTIKLFHILSLTWDIKTFCGALLPSASTGVSMRMLPLRDLFLKGPRRFYLSPSFPPVLGQSPLSGQIDLENVEDT